MDEAPTIVPPAPSEPPTVPAPPMSPVMPKEPWFSGGRAIGVILSVALLVAAGTAAYFFYLKATKKPVVTVVATPTPTPTPTPIRIPSAVATQSAFLVLVQETASLSASLQAYQTQDPSLSPPVLDLPLGFSQ